MTAGGRARPHDPLAERCELDTPACRGPVTVRHHRKGRGRGKNRTVYDAAELTADCCQPCHLYAHAHPDESYEHGWMIRRNGPVQIVRPRE